MRRCSSPAEWTFLAAHKKPKVLARVGLATSEGSRPKLWAPASACIPCACRRAPLGKGGLAPWGFMGCRQGAVLSGGLAKAEKAMSDWLELKIPWWEIVLRASIVYFVMLALLRVSG